MIAFSAVPGSLLHPLVPSLPRIPQLPRQNPSFFFPPSSYPTKKKTLILVSSPRSPSLYPPAASSSQVPSSDAADPTPLPLPSGDDLDSDSDPEPDELEAGDGVEVELAKVGRNRRRIQARVGVDAGMEAVWAVLTDYEGLAGFIPSLAVSRLVEKREGFARLHQVGLQDLAFGLTFEAKGTLDCFEKDLEILPFGRRRDIEFKMIEGDFQTFEGAWSIMQTSNENREVDDFLQGQDFQTVLSYIVELEPKLWLPVRLLEGRLCRDVRTNLLCVRDEAQRVQRLHHGALPSW